jgi:S-adenosylmethionine synthetase
VAAGIADEVLVQVAYAIGVAEPMGLYVNTYGTSNVSQSDGEIADMLLKMDKFDMRPYFIEQRFNLRSPIYSESAAYGHMGRTCETVTKTFTDGGGDTKEIVVKLFPWEELDGVSDLKRAFNL